jgi:5'-nucleotidase/UDP-sugar diphosphatase
MVIQNFGGIRDVLKKGTITPFSIYSIDPFGNGFDTFSMTVAQLRNFLNEFSSRFAYSLDTSFSVQKNSDDAFIFLKDGNLLDDNDSITLSLNDYVSSVFPDLFPASPTFSFPLTTADYLIEYLTDYVTEPIDYLGCSQTNNTLSTDETFSESVVKIYPLYIEINLKEPVFSTEIYSITGQLLHNSVNTNKIDTQFLTKGIYLLKLNSKNGSRFKVQKFIK